MILSRDDEEFEVITSFSNESRVSTIESNEVMFDILSNKLYQYKIRAVLRELSTNAYDAHVVAGIPEIPFKIELPTRYGVVGTPGRYSVEL